jgi:virginiamycin B lyase
MFRKHTVLLATALFAIPMLAGPAFARPQAQEGRQNEPQLPDGPGKDVVESACSVCHSLGNITNSGGHTPQDWKNVLAMMLNVGAAVPDDKVQEVSDYLIKNFPEQPAPAPVLIPGPAEVSFKEWTVPTPGSRPHDPLAAPDGTIWYSGHMGNILGHLDPKTGEIKEFHPKVAKSGPHGLVMDKQGDIWFTANFKAYIGKLDPKTGEFTEYRLDPKARDPHTPLFDQSGNLWFTVQGADMVGKLVPSTGDVKTVSVPTPKANPYGMVITSKGIPFFVEFGANKIASIDPETMAIHEYPLPNENARPRRVAITPEDILYYSDFGRGYLGRFDPKTGAVKEWPSPGGPKSKPYGITAIGDVIWYSESGVKPNTLVRFDTKTEKFQTWLIPSGGGVVRNMMHTKEGNLILTESGINKVALVTVKDKGKSDAMAQK